MKKKTRLVPGAHFWVARMNDLQPCTIIEPPKKGIVKITVPDYSHPLLVSTDKLYATEEAAMRGEEGRINLELAAHFAIIKGSLKKIAILARRKDRLLASHIGWTLGIDSE